MSTIGQGGLQSAVAGLQQVLSNSAAQGAATPEAVRQQAEALSFPYPELAAQVFTFLQTQRAEIKPGLSIEDISEAFMALLMDGKALASLGGGAKSENVWLNVRNVIRNTGFNLGTSLLDVYHAVRKTGLGYTPTIYELADSFATLFKDMQASGNVSPSQLGKLAEQRGFYAWQIALAAAWMRRRKDLSPPTDADLEELFADAKMLAELQQTEGPWDIYVSQGEVLRMLRHFGQSVVDLADETDPE